MFKQETYTRHTAIGTVCVAVLFYFVALVASPGALAHCKGKHADNQAYPDCVTHDHNSGGQGGNNNGNLEATFCMNFATPGAGDLLLSTDDETILGTGGADYDYCDDRDQRVSVVTGKGPGFNFQTYTRNGGTWERSMMVKCNQSYIDDLDWTDEAGDPLNPIQCGEAYAMTFRFDHDDEGLDLGSLAPSETDDVSIFSGLTANNGDSWMFAHGTVTGPGTSGHLGNNPCVAGDGAYSSVGPTTDLQVTRGDANNSDTWTFSHTGDVCLWDRNASLEFQPGIRLFMNYQFTIVCEDPADCIISVP